MTLDFDWAYILIGNWNRMNPSICLLPRQQLIVSWDADK